MLIETERSLLREYNTGELIWDCGIIFLSLKMTEQRGYGSEYISCGCRRIYRCSA